MKNIHKTEIPLLDDYPVTDTRTYKNSNGSVNWRKYAMALIGHAITLENQLSAVNKDKCQFKDRCVFYNDNKI